MTRIGERISRKTLQIEGIDTVSLQVGRAEAGENTWSPEPGRAAYRAEAGSVRGRSNRASRRSCVTR